MTGSGTKMVPTSPSEYRKLQATPYRGALNASMRSAQESDDSGRTSYVQLLRQDKALAASIEQYIEQHWWKEMCCSANTPELHGVLFEKYMFDEEGVLDIKYPGYRKVVVTASIAYLHIKEKYGEATLPGWHLNWSVGGKDGVYLMATNDEIQKCFGMTKPKNGFFDHANEVAALRELREAGKDMTIPDDKKKYYGPGQVGEGSALTDVETTPSKSQLGEDSTLTDIEITPSESQVGEGGALTDVQITPSKVTTATSHIDDEDWSMVDIDGADGDEFEEARRCVPKEDEDYVYKPSDAKKPARRRWFW